jgi:hypothetical protein
MSVINQNGNQPIHIPPNLSNLSPSIGASYFQENSNTITKKVIKVLAPVKLISSTTPFDKETLVTNGNNFGIVNKIIPNSPTPVQIYWWSSGSEEIELKFWYSLNDLRVLKIKPLPLFIPQKTFLTIPAGTLVLTENGELLQWTETLFWLKQINTDGYYLLNQSQEWLFPLENFPGIPFACVNELPSKAVLSATKRLYFPQLKLLISLWLSLNSPVDILELIYHNWETEIDLKYQFIHSEYLAGEDYLQTDLETAWKTGFSSHLKERKSSIGIFGFKIGSRIVQSTPKTVNRSHSSYDYQFGTVVDLEPYSEKSVSIQWEDDEDISIYKISELQNQLISPILPLVKLSSQVGYVLSANEKFYQAIIGFSSKAIANSWWRKIKKELGHLSDLKPHYHPSVQHLKNQMKAKYFYLAQFPHQKTLNARLRHLQIVANWDLTKQSHK